MGAMGTEAGILVRLGESSRAQLPDRGGGDCQSVAIERWVTIELESGDGRAAGILHSSDQSAGPWPGEGPRAEQRRWKEDWARLWW